MRKAIQAVLATLLLAGISFAGVTISSPTPGSTSASPVHFVASASSSHAITAMRIYVDNVSVYAISAASLNTSVTMATGTHSVVVQAWDSTGAVFKTPETITVTAPSGLPVPPSNATTFTNIEDLTGWQSCSVCAGAGGNGPVAVFSMTQHQASPSLDGSSAKFSIGGTTRYADALWWKQLGAHDAAQNFKYDLDFYATSPQFAEALEFDVNQGIGNMKFIFGTECSPKDGAVWKVWDNAGVAWRSTGITCTAPTAFTWHHLTWEFKRTATQVIFIGFSLDGVTHFVNRTYNARAASSQEVNVAFQMDLDSTAQAYSVWLDRVTLAYW